jgi:hypothetical protein
VTAELNQPLPTAALPLSIDLDPAFTMSPCRDEERRDGREVLVLINAHIKFTSAQVPLTLIFMDQMCFFTTTSVVKKITTAVFFNSKKSFLFP